MLNKIYIIGETSIIDANIENKFQLVENKLRKMGFVVENPIEERKVLFNDADECDCRRIYLKKLLDSDAVFLLSCVELSKSQNLELKIAHELGLLFIHDFLILA